MRAYIDIELFTEPQKVGGRNGSREVTKVGQVLGNQGKSRIVRGNTPAEDRSFQGPTYAHVYDADGSHIGDIQVAFGSILAPRVQTVVQA